MKKWKCLVCGYIYEGENPPEVCPVCGVGSDQFKEETPKTKRWKCLICGVIFDGDTPPEVCPVCGAGSDQFEEVEELALDRNFSSSDKGTYIIIGNGAAGYYAASAIRERNSVCTIKIISGEEDITYFRPLLSDYLSKSLKDEEFYLSPKDWYDKNGIELTLGLKISEIKPNEKRVILEDGSEMCYDKLILANGSYSFLPPLKGVGKEGVFTLKYVTDAKNIKKEMEKSKKAVIIGGGLLGLEAAAEMMALGLEVTLVEHNNRLLSRQLDLDGSKLFKEIAEEAGLNFLLSASAEEILGGSHVSGVKFENGEVIDTDIVLFSVGVRSNISIANDTDIKYNRGIIVNEKMETNLKDIYACGDIAEFNKRVYGNWPAAVEMAKVAGANAAGDNVEFKDFVSSTIFKALNTEIFSCGDIPSENYDLLFTQDEDKKIYKKLYFIEDKLVGGILIGDTKNSGKILEAMKKGESLKAVKEMNLI